MSRHSSKLFLEFKKVSDINQVEVMTVSLSAKVIEISPEISTWLSQFSSNEQITAKMLLSRLKFVSRDSYSKWLLRAISTLPTDIAHAIYAVRKLPDDEAVFWDEKGEVVSRPGKSQGSEDLVYSLISNVSRSESPRLLDHPSLISLRDSKVHNFVLIDDSIGSGDRVSGFINAMLDHPTFRSWWSFGFIRINIISYARSRESESNIIAKIRGSDHGKRKFRKSCKIKFTSEVVYSKDWLESRWGENFINVLDLCLKQTKVKKWARLGYGDVMANIVFYHSVPNNIPGIFWFQNKKWDALFPRRVIPDWMLALLEDRYCEGHSTSLSESAMPKDVKQLLILVKRGIRRPETIALRLSCDHKYALGLLVRAVELGLLSEQYRLTVMGLDLLVKDNSTQALPTWDKSMYIPSSWSAGQATIQPPISEELAPKKSADSVEVFASTDGDVGQASLERSDAKAAPPPFRVMPQVPLKTKTRKCHDTDGPLGSKDR
jgi:hypothetical protein